MRLFKSLQRRYLVNDLLGAVREDKQGPLASLMPLFSDRRLADLKKRSHRSIESHIIISDTPVVTAFKELGYHSKSFLEKHPDTGVPEINELVQIVKRVQQEFDPDGTRYPASSYSVPELVLGIASRVLSADFPALTPEQKYAITAVAYFTGSENSRTKEFLSYTPEVRRYNSHNTIDVVLTKRILAKPEVSPLEHADEYVRRLKRNAEVSAILNEEMSGYDNICDYPDDMIEVFAKIRSKDGSALWSRIRDAITSDETTPELLRETLSLFESSDPRIDQWIEPGVEVVKNLSAYPELALSDHAGANDSRKEKRAAFFGVVFSLLYQCSDKKTKHFDANQRLVDTRLVNFLLTNPEQSHEIIDMILDRRTFDFGQFKESLESGSLGNGAL